LEPPKTEKRERERQRESEREAARPPPEVNARISDIATASFSADAERALTPRTFTSAPKKPKKKTLYTKIHSWSGPLSLVRCREMSTAAAPNNGSDSLEISRILNYILKIVKNTNPSNNTQNSTDYVGDS